VEYADQILRHAVKTLPDMVGLHVGLGDALVAAGRRPEDEMTARAANAYEAALKLAPPGRQIVLKCLDLYASLGRNHDGVRVAREYLERFALDDELRTRLGRIYFEMGDYGAARQELKRALKLNPQSRQAASLLKEVEIVESFSDARRHARTSSLLG
jgi:tetratricopeptide (TPR) repeat protein